MIRVVHRVNRIEDLKKIPKEYGVEVDIRNNGTKLILNHDPFGTGDLFENYCSVYDHKLLVLNVKTEGIEDEVLKIIKKSGIKNYFFLDITFPTILKLSEKGEKNIAVRFSEFERVENALNLKGKVHWVWVDTFTKLPLTKTIYEKISGAGFKIFLVGPDRWNREGEIEKYSGYLKNNNMKIDAVMSAIEYIERWR